jgi:soluble lytic murein transglycosylase-like protein
VYIVENSSQVPIQNELPPPNWPLEISPIFTPEVHTWADDIAAWSTAYRIKPNMIATVMQIESCGNPTVVSGAGAIGLFQVLPLHFEAGEDPTDPDINAGRALLYLGELLATTNGDPGLSFAAYNGGQSMLYTSPAEWPTETQNYQYWASGIYEDAESGLAQSPTLADWLDAGGASLCEQAAQQLSLTP